MKESRYFGEILQIGRVIKVDGTKVSVGVDTNKNAPTIIYKDNLVANVSVGGYVNIYKGFQRLVGKIEGESILNDDSSVDTRYFATIEKIKRILNIKIIGYFDENQKFCKGILTLPIIDNPCFLLTHEEFFAIHSPSSESVIRLGTLAGNPLLPIEISIDKLMGSHIGIFGNTGSGKSYTLARLYTSLFKQVQSSQKIQGFSHFILFDFNGEYIAEDRPNILTNACYKRTFSLTTSETKSSKYPIDAQALENSEILGILFEATEKTQLPFIKRTLANRKLKEVFEEKKSEGENVNKRIKDYLKETLIKRIIEKNDSNCGKKILIELLGSLRGYVPNDDVLDEIIEFSMKNIGQVSTGSFYVEPKNLPSEIPSNSSEKFYSNRIEEYFLTPLNEKIDKLVFETDSFSKLGLKLYFKYYEEIISGFSNPEHLGPLLTRVGHMLKDLKCVFDINKDIAQTSHQYYIDIISFRYLHNTKLKKIIPLVIIKFLYNLHKNKEKGHLNVIIDEAHNILSEESTREAEQWKDYRLETFEEIIKEGRKFGVFLTIASQRPADISPTILSQVHNFFIHRLVNDKDLASIQKAVSYMDKVSFDKIPNLPVGVAFFSGVATNMPLEIKIDRIPENISPKNDTFSATTEWGLFQKENICNN